MHYQKNIIRLGKKIADQQREHQLEAYPIKGFVILPMQKVEIIPDDLRETISSSEWLTHIMVTMQQEFLVAYITVQFQYIDSNG